MTQTREEIVADLRSYVRGRGRDDNFMFNKVYSPSSAILSVDFSSWVGKRIIMKDTLALALFSALHYEPITLRVSTSMDTETDNIEESKKRRYAFRVPKSEINRYKKEIQIVLDFPFERYFVNEIGSAKMDLLIAWFLGYSEKKFPKIMMAYCLELRNAITFLKQYNDRKKKQFELPAPLPNDLRFQDFQRELGKLPLATRLHLFDVYEYSTYGGKQMQKHLSEKTLYDTRAAGIDVNESAEILRQSKLITSFPDGRGTIASEYIEPVSIALDYAKKLEPIYYEWKSEVGELISNKTSGYFYDDDNQSNDGYFDTEV